MRYFINKLNFNISNILTFLTIYVYLYLEHKIYCAEEIKICREKGNWCTFLNQ